MISVSRRLLLTAVAVVLVAGSGARAEQDEAVFRSHWVGTWASSPVPPGAPFSTDNSDLSRDGFNNQTIRQLVRTSVGGHGVRVRLSNAYGERPLTVGHATVALPESAPDPGIMPASVRELTFAGRKQITIPRGAQVLSDPADLAVPATQELVISLYLPGPTGPVTWHWTALQTSYVSGAGDYVADPSGAVFTTKADSWFLLSGVEVQTRSPTGAVVALGDSITDGFGSTVNANRRWTDRLAERLVPRHQAVLNAGISGNQILRDGSELGFPGIGVNALARFERDVLSRIGARTVIVAEGINDIHSDATADELIAGLGQIAAQGRAAGLRVLLGTIGPSEGSIYGHTPAQEAVRAAVNDYIRTGVDFDGTIDFDAALGDPKNPRQLLPAYDSGDHLHPNDAGYQAMANAVPLSLLR